MLSLAEAAGHSRDTWMESESATVRSTTIWLHGVESGTRGTCSNMDKRDTQEGEASVCETGGMGTSVGVLAWSRARGRMMVTPRPRGARRSQSLAGRMTVTPRPHGARGSRGLAGPTLTLNCGPSIQEGLLHSPSVLE